MNTQRILHLAIAILFLAAFASCTPSITVQPTANLDAGQVKTLRAVVKAPCGLLDVTSQYKNRSTANWINLVAPARTGNLYSSAIPGSETFGEGETYDFRWAVEYDRKRTSVFSGCETIPAATKTANGSFTVPVCVPGNLSALAVPLRGQRTNQWCWAASGQMIMEYLGTNVQQCTEANDRFGRNDCCNDGAGTCGSLVNTALYLARHAACINPGWPQFGNYGFDADILNGALSWENLRKQLSTAAHCRETPVGFSWGWTGGGGHMMVAYGYLAINVPFWGPWNFVAVRDPWPPCSGDSKVITYNEYVERDGDHEHWDDYYNIRRQP